MILPRISRCRVLYRTPFDKEIFHVDANSNYLNLTGKITVGEYFTMVIPVYPE